MKERFSTLLSAIGQFYLREVRPRLEPLLAPFSPWHRRAMAVAALLVIIGLLLPGPPSPPDVTLRHVDPPSNLADQSDSQGSWHTYHVAAGETLAQLFRDQGLAMEALYAMVNVQGSDKPLGTLSAGQAVKIRMTSNNTVTGLTLENTRGQVLFVRQEDGRFLRVQ
ncbi:LysM-like peptidoglycan-binding domain-containing protein [Rosenbergiella nectarea]|uniref:LysM-like peptidoglycan-binding domain-containing protein n=1 Tax=Rosenbergiella nectarea TaxID=988801 RepID=UPI001F4E57DC|nr:LysM-like peptidoglycan-binding domain-containing protein [Rosenbergiella nectarea]